MINICLFMTFYNCGLQSENIRWSQSIKHLEAQEKTLCGDVLLTAAFVSYVGSFMKQYRQELVEHLWIPFLRSQEVKHLVGNGSACLKLNSPQLKA